jgi:hypothetical protein
MKIMMGIDLHSNNALCGLMDENGRRLVHQKLPCDLAAILQLLEPYKNRIATIAIESTFNWYWLVDGLQDPGYRVGGHEEQRYTLAHERRLRGFAGATHRGAQGLLPVASGGRQEDSRRGLPARDREGDCGGCARLQTRRRAVTVYGTQGRGNRRAMVTSAYPHVRPHFSDSYFFSAFLSFSALVESNSPNFP